MEYKKHRYDGKDLKEIETAFKKIEKMLDKNAKSLRNYDFENEFVKINTLCELVTKMYELNDFVASSYAYMYTVPATELLIKNVNDAFNNQRTTADKKKAAAFAVGKSELAQVRTEDGSIKECTNLEYCYTYLYYKQMAIAGRYFIKYNIQYLERHKSEKAYPKRARILQAAIWWANQMLLGRFGLKMPDCGRDYTITPKVMIFSTFPSSGKSFLCNTFNEMYSELAQIISKNGGVLRVGNEQGNITRQSRQTMNLIDNKVIFDIYPENLEMISRTTGKYRPFSKESEEEWGLDGCEFEPNTSIFKTRDSAINSIRCRVGMFDDPSRGIPECTNVELHKRLYEVYNGDFQDRFDNQDDKCILLTGTMFNPFDVFSMEIQKAFDIGCTRDKRFRGCYVCKDGETVIVLNDCEDEYGNSAYPEMISNKELINKRNSLSPYLYACVWRQKPIPADGLLFAKEELKFYDELPEADLTSYSFAYIDPNRRKASDYFCMVICRRHKTDGQFYYTDCIYERKSTKQLYDKVAQKIVANNVIKLVYEENIDLSFDEVIKTRLKDKGYNNCKISTEYSVVNKQQRIADMADTIKGNIVFPSQKYISVQSPLGYSVRALQEYDAEKSRNDDMPDACAGFADNFVVAQKPRNVIKTSSKLPI